MSTQRAFRATTTHNEPAVTAFSDAPLRPHVRANGSPTPLGRVGPRPRAARLTKRGRCGPARESGDDERGQDDSKGHREAQFLGRRPEASSTIVEVQAYHVSYVSQP